MTDVTAVRVDGTPQEPGEFSYYTSGLARGISGLVYRCPCRCGGLFRVRFGWPHTGDRHPDGHPRWVWDGDVESPSLDPLVRNRDARTGRSWQGRLIQGVWQGD